MNTQKQPTSEPVGYGIHNKGLAFDAPQPVPCPACGQWKRNWREAEDRIVELRAKTAELEAENARLTKGYNEWKAYANQCVADVKEAEDTIEQQAERIKALHQCLISDGVYCGELQAQLARQSEVLKIAKEALPKLLDKAFLFGENHWREADSESYAANKRSEVTLEKYQAFKAEALAAITEIEGAGK